VIFLGEGIMQYIEADIFFDNGMNAIISPVLGDKFGIGRASGAKWR
jgi:hypothetical protein